MLDSLRQVQVVGALARLAGNGGWASILAGESLEDDLDLADARLLLAAGVLAEADGGRIGPVDLHPWYDDPAVLASGLVAQLRRALHHGQGTNRASLADRDDILAMGVASQSVAAILADAVLPMLPVTRERLSDGTARFLDVGVGTGAIAETLCTEFPGVQAVGLDVSTEALEVAKERLADSPVGERIELRQQSVVDLREKEAYDLAWLPQIFIARRDLETGIDHVHRALRPDCWLVMAVAAKASDSTDLERAAVEHDAVVRGGGPMSVEQATQLLCAAGFVEIRDMRGVAQSLVMARRV